MWRLAQRVLAGKDVFIEKPMVLELKQGEELVELADRAGLLIQTGHLLLFHPAVAHLKELVHRGELGNLHYIYTQRLNLGTVRTEENALWSLAPHDISLANYLFDAEPTAVSAEGGRFLQQTIEDVAFLHLHYPNNRLAHIHVSWLDSAQNAAGHPRRVAQNGGLRRSGSKREAADL